MIKRQNQLRSNIRIVILDLEDTEYEVELTEAIHRGYSRPRIEDNNFEEDELPEHILWRLFLARQLALLKYKEVWG